MSQPEKQPRHAGLARRLAETRTFSETLCEPLTAEDMGLQACPEVSPPRWHLAHTTWFFETFILKPFEPGYKPADERFEYRQRRGARLARQRGRGDAGAARRPAPGR